MDPVRYRPGEAIRWLQTGADALKKDAGKKTKAATARPSSAKDAAAQLREGVEALFDYGKGAWADLVHAQAEASEYVLLEDRFDIVKPGAIKSIPYARVARIERKGDRYTLVLDRGVVIVKPYAHVVAGRVRVPVGWTRNGAEVPYELLPDELAARCGRKVEELD